MNQNLGVQGLSQSRILENESQSFQVILNFLRMVEVDANRTLEFSKAFEVREFQLGRCSY